jgi:hypothetical protein
VVEQTRLRAGKVLTKEEISEVEKIKQHNLTVNVHRLIFHI